MKSIRLVSLFLIASVGCAAEPASSDEPLDVSDGNDGKADGTGLNALDELISEARADGNLTFSEAETVEKAELHSPVTRGGIDALVSLFEKPPATVETIADGSNSTATAADGGLTLARYMYLGLPRTVRGYSGSGQTFSETLIQDTRQAAIDEEPTSPASLHVMGTATKSYLLTFYVVETTISVDIHSGSTAAQTAHAIAAALDSHAAAIVSSQDASTAIDFEPYTDEVLVTYSAAASGADVVISLSLEG